MLGVDTPVSLLVLREIFVQGLLAFLFAIPFYPLIRRVLRPAIVDDVVAGRRMGSSRSAPAPTGAPPLARAGGARACGGATGVS